MTATKAKQPEPLTKDERAVDGIEYALIEARSALDELHRIGGRLRVIVANLESDT